MESSTEATASKIASAPRAFRLFLDFRSPYFSRATTKIKNTNVLAGGCGFLLSTAVNKARSEAIEREFYYERAKENIEFTPLGIAAHPCLEKAKVNAEYETYETLIISKICKSLTVSGRPLINTRKFKLWFSRFDYGWFSIAVGLTKYGWLSTYCCEKSLIKCLLRCWSEYVQGLYSKCVDHINRFSKTNIALGQQGIKKLVFIRTRKPLVLSPFVKLKHHYSKIENHFVYFIKKEKI